MPGADLAAARLGLDELTGEVAVDARLAVGDRPVPWWPGEPDRVDGSPGSLGRALAWRAVLRVRGRPHQRPVKEI